MIGLVINRITYQPYFSGCSFPSWEHPNFFVKILTIIIYYTSRTAARQRKNPPLTTTFGEQLRTRRLRLQLRR